MSNQSPVINKDLQQEASVNSVVSQRWRDNFIPPHRFSSGIRLNSTNRPYLGSISSNLNPRGLGRPPRRYHPHYYHPGTTISPPAATRIRALAPPPNNTDIRPHMECYNSMMDISKIQVFEINFDKDRKPVFEPGQEITGKVVLVCSEPIRIRSLSVNMKGFSKTDWSEMTLSGYEKQFNDEIEYFNFKKYLLQPRTNGGRHYIAEGLHEYNFRFHIPFSEDISTSFEGSHGFIRYFVKADMHQSWAFTHRTKKAFTIISPIDVNTQYNRIPVIREGGKTIWCWPCSMGEVAFRASTDRNGYCPGEVVSIDASYVNQSSRRMRPQACLYQIQTFNADGKTRTKQYRFSAVAGRNSDSEEGNWDTIHLKIPPVSPSVLNCKLIKVEYAIKVQILISGSPSISVRLPIVIGTIPQRRSIRLTARESREVEAALSAITEEAGLANISEEDDSPPSYFECLDSEVDLTEAGDFSESTSLHGQTRFAPLYRYVRSDDDESSPPSYSEIDPYPMSSGRIACGESGGNTRTNNQDNEEHEEVAL